MQRLRAPLWLILSATVLGRTPQAAATPPVVAGPPAPEARAIALDSPIELHLATGAMWSGGSSVRLDGSISGPHDARTAHDPEAGTLTVTSARPFLPGERVHVAIARSEGFPSMTLDLRVAAAPGSARFAAGARLAAGAGPTWLVAADLDRDGDVDLAISEMMGQDAIHIYLNDGLGRFAPGDIVAVPGLDDPGRFAAGDLDEDGFLDLVVTGEVTGNLVVLRGRGDGRFAPGPLRALEARTPVHAVIGDLNLDGHVDVLVAHLESSDRVTVLFGDGDGGFLRERRARAGRGVESLALADLDGDGDLDLATANEEGDQVVVLRNAGDGRLEIAGVLPAGKRPEAIAAGDLDGDGMADLVSVNQGSSDVLVFLGAGDLSYAPPASYPAGDRPFTPALADLDGDGDLDLAVPGLFSDDVTVLLNDGEGKFTAGARFAVDPGPVAVAAADLDGDGALDLAVASSVADNAQVWANTAPEPAVAALGPEPAGLAQNVPNPFNPATEIPYSLAAPSHVSLVVFNTSGKVVRTLVDRFESPGNHVASWDGINDAGDKLPSGIYFYRLTTGETVELRRMTLLR